MKKRLLKILILLAVMFFSLTAVNAQYYPPDGPAPKVDNPLSPYVQYGEITDYYNSRAFGYLANGGSIPIGTFKMFLNSPTMTSLSPDALGFIAAASFASNGYWYGVRYASSGSRPFVRIDTSTGYITTISSSAIQTSVTGLAYDWTSSTMYAMTYTNPQSQLGTINLSTGVISLIGSPYAGLIIDIACSNSGQIYGQENNNDNFVSINKFNGSVTVIGSIGYDAGFAQGMSWDHSTDSCFIASYGSSTYGQLRRVNLQTGMTSVVFSFPSNAEVDGFAIPGPIGPPPLSAPSLISPSNGATNVSTSPTLDWSDVSTATSYQVQVSINSGFSSTVVDQSGLSSSNYTVPGGTLSPGTTYYWRAKAFNSTQQSGWSNVFYFTTSSGPPPLSAPVLISPVNGATGVVLIPTLDWSDVAEASTYQVQVSANPGFSPTVVDQSALTYSQYIVPSGILSGLTTYYWRAKSFNSTQQSVWSNVFSFTTTNVPPPPPPVLCQRIEFYEQNMVFNSSNPLNLVDPGQYVRFKLNIQNNLTANILTGFGTITTSTPNVTITDNTCTFNNVLSGQSAWSVDELEVLIGENFQRGTRINITLTVTQQIPPTGPWVSEYSFPVAPMIVSSFLIDDDSNPDSQGNNNDVCEPGEKIEIIPLVKNISAEIMYTNNARLSTPITWLNIWNGVTGVSGIVYDTWKLKLISNVQQPINPGEDGVQPEQDYVFGYNAPAAYKLPMFDIFTSYFNAAAGSNWWAGGIKIKYSGGFWINPNLSPPIGIKNIGSEIPKEYKLYYNYPNPFNPVTKIVFDIPKQSVSELTIYDISGRVIETIVNENLQAGKYEVQWNASNYSSGVYFYRLQTSTFTDTKKMLLVK